MEKRYTMHEIRKMLEVDEPFVCKLEREKIIRVEYGDDGSPFFDSSEVDKLRFAKVLMDDMEVNLPGVEVILRMRRNMVEMRRQFDSILEEVVKQLQAEIPGHTPSIRISHKNRDSGDAAL